MSNPMEQEHECKECGRLTSPSERRLYKGPLYKDTINNEPYCIMCSKVFYKSKNLPDGVAREQ